MSDNRFKDCETAEGVLLSYSQIYDQNPQTRADALARIAELSPRTVDAADRERAIAEARKWWNEPVDAHGPDEDAGCPNLVDRIINALGWAAAEPEPHQCADVADDCCERTPAPATPAVEPDWHVDFAPDELRTLAKIVDGFERLYSDVAQVVAPDTMRTTLDLDIIDGDLPVRVVCNDHGCWVLRIGGTDE